MTAGRLILDDGELTCHGRGDGPPVVPRHDRPDGFDRAPLRFPSASR